VRVVVYILLAINLVYLAWAGWIDTPPPPPPAPVTKPLPQLALVTEGITRSADRNAEARPVAQSSSALTEPVTAVANTGGRCVSVGPFNDLSQAARGAALLRERGFDPRQRAEQGDTWEGFWVYVGGLGSAEDETKLMKALEKAGIKDARAMAAEAESGRRVSVGLFSERDRAESRAQAVKRLGYEAEITERRQAGAVYWIDLELGSVDRAVPTEGLLSLEDSGSRLEIRVCPAGESGPSSTPAQPAPLPRDARPAATTADAGLPRPG
jgi:hypothetical protein